LLRILGGVPLLLSPTKSAVVTVGGSLLVSLAIIATSSLISLLKSAAFDLGRRSPGLLS
jgi:hypothetical protein